MRSIPAPSAPQSIDPHPPRAARKLRRPRILIVTPELNGSGFLARNGRSAPRAKAGGLADVATLLVDELAARSIDVRVAMPHYRNLFAAPEVGHSRRLHLCRDREFFYRRSVYEGGTEANRRAALAFQRDVIHHVLPQVRPDLIHCHDWMTALIPAAARQLGIPCLFTLHNLHNEHCTLAEIEDRGIDAAAFWQELHYDRFPQDYEHSRQSNTVNWMASAIHASSRINTVSPTFLSELLEGRHPAAWDLGDVLHGKARHQAAEGILNGLDPSYRPAVDPCIARRYDSGDHATAKRWNKLALQASLGLEQDADAPMLFWPSRLDPVQKGCHLLADILYRLVSDYWGLGLQVVFVADGPFQPHFDHIAGFHGLRHRIAVRPFQETLSRQAYAASDYTLVPSAYEPCGLAQMVALSYGSLPVVHRTGGLADTVTHLDAAARSGNGFVFDHHDCRGLRWAIDEAIRFHILPDRIRHREIGRIMEESIVRFSPRATTDSYLRIYSELTGRPIAAAG
jgi:ADP-glucose type glycogen/starch synthase